MPLDRLYRLPLSKPPNSSAPYIGDAGAQKPFFWACGAECNNPGHWNEPPVGTPLIVSGGSQRTGTYDFKITSTTAVEYFMQAIPAGNRQVNASFYVKFNTLAGTAHEIFMLRSLAGNTGRVIFDSADNKLKATYNAGTVSVGPVVTTGVWYLVDVKVDTTANPTLIDFQVDGVAGTPQGSFAQAAFDVISHRGGSFVAVTVDFELDDVVVSLNSLDYPIGPHTVDLINGYEVVQFTPPAVTGTSASSFSWSDSATGAEDIPGTVASTFGWSDSATGINAEPITGTVASSFSWSDSATGAEDFTGTVASTFGWSDSATGAEGFTGTAASTFGWSDSATGAEGFTGTVASTFGWAARAPAYPATVRPMAPVGYWRLGEPSGTTAVDEMGASNGTYVNTPTLGATGLLTGDADTAITLNGTDEYATVPHVAALNLGDGPFTLAAWIKRASNGTEDAIFGKGEGAYYFYIGSDDYLYLARLNIANVVASLGQITDTNAHLVIATYNGGTTGKLYIDGTNQTNWTDSSVMLNTITPLGIGSQDGTGAWAPFNGTLDEAAIWNRALSDMEIAALYTAGALGTDGTVIAPVTGTSATTFTWSDTTSGTVANPVTGTSATSFTWSDTANGTEDEPGVANSVFGWSSSATGSVGYTGTVASTFGWSDTATGAEGFTGTSATSFTWSTAATGSEGYGGTVASQFGWSDSATGTSLLHATGTVASTFGWSDSATGTVVIVIIGTVASTFGWRSLSNAPGYTPENAAYCIAYGYLTTEEERARLQLDFLLHHGAHMVGTGGMTELVGGIYPVCDIVQ